MKEFNCLKLKKKCSFIGTSMATEIELPQSDLATFNRVSLAYMQVYIHLQILATSARLFNSELLVKQKKNDDTEEVE